MIQAQNKACVVLVTVLVVVSLLELRECEGFKLHPHPASFARKFRGYQPTQVPSANMLCSTVGEECNPYLNECCAGTECLSVKGGYCNHKLEPCACLPDVQGL